MTQINKKGFTLIELMLALSFIGILLVITVVTIIHVTNQYSRGITLKSINQAGRELGASMKRDAASATGITTLYVDPSQDTNSHLGRLCLGAYSYVWNTPEALRSGGPAPALYSDNKTPIVMARVPDVGGSFCAHKSTTDSSYPSNVDKNAATEMLPNTDGEYAIHNVTVASIPAAPTGAEPVLYDIKYTIGTNQDGTINTSMRCEAPDNATNNFNFCSINEFEIMVQAGYKA